ncbi:MarR family winged helix-turn-helix transcriptional regulator [Roseomonas sp. BN140053]|uniref:MarR family winged helix-turn-helix transcriptional regulator n=1 Tax=Roseomonas sp. BN140053 TaxID=3391898 RepID=UPI0039ECD2FC
MTGRDALAPVLDAETKVGEAPEHHVQELRLWLRLLTCTNLIESEVRRRLRVEFDMTLPRFDFLAQLDRMRDGMTLGQLSRRMMVSNGNVTLVAEKLEAEGLITRSVSATDRRVVLVQMTAAGRRLFRKVAAAHAGWLGELLGGMRASEMQDALSVLACAKESIRQAQERAAARDPADEAAAP